MLRRLLVAASLAAVPLAVAIPAASARTTSVGIERFNATNAISPNGPTGGPAGPVTASGVINDQGTDVVVSDNEDQFVFPDGTLTVFHAARNNVDHFDANACTDTFTEHGIYVFGNGTGVWAGYSGSGRYVARGTITNACGDTASGTVTISARGPINPPQQQTGPPTD